MGKLIALLGLFSLVATVGATYGSHMMWPLAVEGLEAVLVYAGLSLMQKEEKDGKRN